MIKFGFIVFQPKMISVISTPYQCPNTIGHNEGQITEKKGQRFKSREIFLNIFVIFDIFSRFWDFFFKIYFKIFLRFLGFLRLFLRFLGFLRFFLDFKKSL